VLHLKRKSYRIRVDIVRMRARLKARPSWAWIKGGWASSSGPLPKAARRVSVAKKVEVVDTILDRAASVLLLDKYHIALELDGTNDDKNRSTGNLFNKHEIFEHCESLP
jgi:hypothetical protein